MENEKDLEAEADYLESVATDELMDGQMRVKAEKNLDNRKAMTEGELIRFQASTGFDADLKEGFDAGENYEPIKEI